MLSDLFAFPFCPCAKEVKPVTLPPVTFNQDSSTSSNQDTENVKLPVTDTLKKVDGKSDTVKMVVNKISEPLKVISKFSIYSDHTKQKLFQRQY